MYSAFNRKLELIRQGLLREGLDRMVPFVTDVIAKALANTDFRRVIFTGRNVQLVLMSIPNGGEIGEEKHRAIEQVFYCVGGRAMATLDGAERMLTEGDVLIVPAGTEHNLTCLGPDPLQLYTTYSPPNHLPGRVHHTKADADADLDDEAFGSRVR